MTFAVGNELVAVVVDPARGGVIQSLSVRGVDLLLEQPSAADPSGVSDVDEETWASEFAGGWQLLTPNAGNATVVDGIAHGFHGAASRSAWGVRSHSADSMRIHWEGHGLSVARSIQLEPDGVLVETTWTCRRPSSAITVEHCIVGGAFLQGPLADLRISPLPSHSHGVVLARELTEDPGGECGHWAEFPHAGAIGGGVERIDAPSGPGRLYALADIAGIEIWERGRPTRLRLTFGGVLNSLWLWVPAIPGRLGIEPASVADHRGLSHALRHGTALTITPERPARSWTRLQLVDT